MARTVSARVRHLLVALLVGVSGAVALAAVQGRSDQAPALGAGDEQFVPNEVLVQFVADAGEAEQDEARGRVGGRRDEVILAAADREDGKGDLEVMALPPGLTVANAMARLHAHPAVEFAEPNWIYRHEATSNDPYYTNGSLWGMYGDAHVPGEPVTAARPGRRGPRERSVRQASTSASSTRASCTPTRTSRPTSWTNPFDPG